MIHVPARPRAAYRSHIVSSVSGDGVIIMGAAVMSGHAVEVAHTVVGCRIMRYKRLAATVSHPRRQGGVHRGVEPAAPVSAVSWAHLVLRTVNDHHWRSRALWRCCEADVRSTHHGQHSCEPVWELRTQMPDKYPAVACSHNDLATAHAGQLISCFVATTQSTMATIVKYNTRTRGWRYG